MNSTKRIFVLIVISLLLLRPSCKEKGIEPPPPPKNPREYTWTIDTLAYPGSFQTLMYDIWASNPQDAYVVGDNDRGFGKMYHFDSKQWKPVDLAFSIGSLNGIIGFGPNSILAVGDKIYQNPNPPPNFLDSSLVILYDGTKWQEVKLERQRALIAIWGSAPNDIWMGGLNGTLYHYDGITMKKDSVPLAIPKDAEPFYSFYSITGRSSNDVYLLLYAPPLKTGGERYYIFTRQAEKWIAVDSVFYSYRRRLWMSPAGSLYAIGGGVHKRVGNSWQNLQMDALNSLGIAGTSDDDFFVAGNSGVGGFSAEVFHYNGTDWFHYQNLQLRNVQYYGIWTDGREVFVVGVTLDYPMKTIILHGR